jgi:acyl-CoA thioester hydrolase
MRLSEFPWSYSFRVRWSETDAQGVVFNARYLDYADIAITEYWRTIGFREAYPDEPLEFHVARATVNFRKPIKSDEMLTVSARTTHFGRTSMTYQVAIFGSAGDEDLRAEVDLVYVHVDLSTHMPTPFPNWLPEKFTAFDTLA